MTDASPDAEIWHLRAMSEGHVNVTVFGGPAHLMVLTLPAVTLDRCGGRLTLDLMGRGGVSDRRDTYLIVRKRDEHTAQPLPGEWIGFHHPTGTPSDREPWKIISSQLVVSDLAYAAHDSVLRMMFGVLAEDLGGKLAAALSAVDPEIASQLHITRIGDTRRDDTRCATTFYEQALLSVVTSTP